MKALLFVLALIVSGSAAARDVEPIVNFSEVAVVAASGKSLSIKQVKQVIRTAAEGKKWVLVDQPDGKMLGTLAWRGNRHSISVEIACSAKSYSITYRDSINMKYTMVGGQASIHPYYNRYLMDLRDAIKFELTRL